MNERNLPRFDTENIKRRICRLENLLGRPMTRDLLDIDLVSQVVMTLASECERFNTKLETNPQAFK